MGKKTLIIVLLACVLGMGFAQQRAKKQGPADFTKVLESVRASWAEERYGSCLKELQTCVNLVTKKRAAAIRAALPAAPADWKIKPEKDTDEAANNPMLAAMAASVGNMIERQYQSADGKSKVDVSVMADSPMVQMLSIAFMNPAALGEDGEVVGYGDHQALFQKQGRMLTLQIIISKKHLVEVKFRVPKSMEFEAAEKIIFGLFDQAAVDRLAAVLAK